MLRPPAAACAAALAAGGALAGSYYLSLDRRQPGVMLQRVVSRSGHDVTPLPLHQKAQLFAKLAMSHPQAAYVASGSTEFSFRGESRASTGGTEPWDCDKPGTYVSAACGLPLFRSDDKFSCGCGWPSFTAPFDKEHVVETNDFSHEMIRVEVCEARTGAHLGHVFDDGPVRPPAFVRLRHLARCDFKVLLVGLCGAG